MPLYQPIEDPLETVFSFFEDVVEKYVVGDLETLAEIRPEPWPPNRRGCTVPESLAVFAVLDLMGFLMRKDFDDEKQLDIDRLIKEQANCTEPKPDEPAILKRIGEQATRTGDNLEYMLEKWLGRESTGYDKLTIALIIKLFRHGGAHQFLPKAAGIAKRGKERPLIEFGSAQDGFTLPVLNEDRFREDALAALERIRQIMMNKDDHELMNRCEDTVKELAIRMSKRLAVRHWLDREALKKCYRKKRLIYWTLTAPRPNFGSQCDQQSR